ncbi:MAG TPA: M48 family metalloprotease [Puia sp.]|nr:M48 family metalloprotease [Puia sp.]
MTGLYRMSLFIWLIMSIGASYAQVTPLYTYQDLSHIFYAKQKDSLKKAWVCPSVYKTKETQKQYKEIWDQRTDFITGAIADDAYVKDQDVYPYIDGIIDQIVQANKQLMPVKPFLLLDRSPSVNAYAVGGNVIAVNLGLISWSQSREELALAIAHELSHNILEHTETAIKQRAEMLTSDEYKQSMNAILDSKYQRLTRLQQVLQSYSFNRSRHQRYHESDADSLAIILLKQANIAFDADFFLRLDSSDILYRQPLKQPVKDYFVCYQLPFQDSWTQRRTRGLSTRNYNFKDSSSLDDSLKTHPDCEERYERTKKFTTAGMHPTPIPAGIKDKTEKMLLWSMYQNQSLTPCLYRLLMEKDKGNKDEWYDFMMSNIFSGLYYADKELHRFNAIGVTQKEYISKQYYELQNMLEQMPRESLEQYCKTLQSGAFWKDMSPAELALKNFFYVLTLAPDGSGKNTARAAKDFAINNSGSMYCEFAGTFFEKK